MAILERIMTVAGAGFDSRAVANRILERARQKGRQLTIMQLVKLIYFAQGWYLAFTNRPLTQHAAHAWQYGPVYPLVYKAFPKAGSEALEGVIVDKSTGKPFSADFTADEDDLIDWIIDEYGGMHAFKLSQLSHVDGGPWKVTMDATGVYSEIPNSLMRSYFKRFTENEQP